MLIGEVIGTVISTRKNSKLVGSKFLIIQPRNYTESSQAGTTPIVAVDTVGAGVGEIVLVATGSAARIGCQFEGAPIDAAIVGIVDDEKDIAISK